MEISAQGVELIKAHEGLCLEAYVCPGGRATVGYGHTKGVVRGTVITLQEAERLLREDLKEVQECVNALALTLTQCQYDALCSFVFNVGCGALRSSTLLKEIRQNPVGEGVRREWMRWVHVGGAVLPGLRLRRESELELWFSDEGK